MFFVLFCAPRFFSLYLKKKKKSFLSCPIVSLLRIFCQENNIHLPNPTPHPPTPISCSVRVFLIHLDCVIMEALHVKIISSQGPNTKWIISLLGGIVQHLLRWRLDFSCPTFCLSPHLTALFIFVSLCLQHLYSSPGNVQFLRIRFLITSSKWREMASIALTVPV